MTVAASTAACSSINADSKDVADNAMSEVSVAIADAMRAGQNQPARTIQFGDKTYPALAALGPVPVPPDNPMSDEKVELGKILFFDWPFRR